MGRCLTIILRQGSKEISLENSLVHKLYLNAESNISTSYKVFIIHFNERMVSSIRKRRIIITTLVIAKDLIMSIHVTVKQDALPRQPNVAFKTPSFQARC